MDATKITLYGITEEIQSINHLLEESGGEITEEIELKMNEITELAKSKTDNVVGYVRYLEDSILAVKTRKEELAKLEKSIKTKMESFKNYVANCFLKVDMVKVEGELSYISIPKRRAVLKVEEQKLPLEFFKVIPEQHVPDTDKIKNYLKAGEEVLGASFEEGKLSINFKYKKGVK